MRRPFLPHRGGSGPRSCDRAEHILQKVRSGRANDSDGSGVKEIIWRHTGFRRCPRSKRITEDEAVAECGTGWLSCRPEGALGDHHSQDGCWRGTAECADADAVRKAYRVIKTSVTEKAGAEHFLGVTVQPFVKRDGYELILGSTVDSQFGPVLLFGAGGQLVEIFRDRALSLPPLNTTLARRMMEQTRVFQALAGCPWPQSRGHGCARGSIGALQSSLWLSSGGSKKSTSILCWLPLTACRRWMRE